MKINKILPLVAMSPTLLLPQMLNAQEKAKQPNIIMFLVDDMGWQDTSVPFFGSEPSLLNKRFRTPNMERLANMGVKFTQAYACSVSSPTRCSLMSGMNAARHRVTNWTLNYNTKTDGSNSVISVPEWNCNGIQPETSTNIPNATPITSFPQILHDNGYYTIHCGKAHFGANTTPGANPSTMGFDVNIGGGANGAPASYLSNENFGTGSFHVNGLEKYYNTGKFLTECLTEEAISYMDSAATKEQPFYLYMSHYAVHSPYSKDTRFYDNYFGHADEALSHDNVNPTTINSNEACYCALVEGMDKSLGDIIDYISERGIADNTIILFMSDNGGQPLSPRQGANFTQNLPARAGKGSAFDGGVHEPMIVYVPNVTKGGSENSNRVIIEDFFPTILDMAGIEDYRTAQTIDGVSFWDILNDTTQTRERTLYWHFPNLWGETQNKEYGYSATSSIMKGDYHLIYTWETQTMCLYNIKEDIHENVNLAARMPEKTNELAADLSNYLRSCNAQRPSFKSSNQLIGWPDEVGTFDDEALPFTLSQSTVEASMTEWPTDMQWHTMTIGGSYCSYSPANGEVTATTSSTYHIVADELLWAFVGDDHSGYKVYNKAAGANKVLWCEQRSSDSDSPVTMTEIAQTDGIYWSIAKFSGSWNMVRAGSVDNFLSKRLGKLGMRNTVKAQGEAASAMTFMLYTAPDPNIPLPVSNQLTLSVDEEMMKATNMASGIFFVLKTIANGTSSYGSGAQVPNNCFNPVTKTTDNSTLSMENVLYLEDAGSGSSYYIRSVGSGYYVGSTADANRNLSMKENRDDAIKFVVQAASSAPGASTGFVNGSTLILVSESTKNNSNGGIRLNCEVPGVSSGVRVGSGAFSYWNAYRVNLSIPFNEEDGYATLYLSFNSSLAPANPQAGVSYFTATISDDNTLRKNKIGGGDSLTLSALSPILVQASSTINILPTASAPQTLPENDLKGTLIDVTPAPDNSFILSVKGDTTAFYPTFNCIENKVYANQAYIIGADGNSIYNLDASTRVVPIFSQEKEERMYNLKGQRVYGKDQGIVIKGNKKIIQ